MKVSVIIPALNEEKYIKASIESAKRLMPMDIIVVDGGSTDRTKEIAQENGAIVIQSHKGRGIQMNMGASLAKGDLLLFLHADSVLGSHPNENENPNVVFEEILASCFLSNDIENYIGGFFKLAFDDKAISTKLVELFANIRARLFSLPYGDQALFIKKEIFNSIGGFKNYMFLEDIDMVLRLRRVGKLKCLSQKVIVSARRLKKGYPLSPIIVSLRNVLIALLFIFGASPHNLLRLYR